MAKSIDERSERMESSVSLTDLSQLGRHHFHFNEKVLAVAWGEVIRWLVEARRGLVKG